VRVRSTDLLVVGIAGAAVVRSKIHGGRLSARVSNQAQSPRWTTSAPHRAGDALRGGPGLLDPSHPDLDASLHDEAASKIRQALEGVAGQA